MFIFKQACLYQNLKFKSSFILRFLHVFFFQLSIKQRYEIKVIIAEIVKVREFPYGNPRPPYTSGKTVVMAIALRVSLGVNVATL